MGTVEIKEYKQYIGGMAKGIEEKSFFLEHTKDANSLLDYGCADGTLLKYIHGECGSLFCVGYDIDESMTMLAASNLSETGFPVCSVLTDAMGHIDPSDSILNLSSIIHEVYSYSPKKEVDAFWEFVFNSGFKYIAIRDMFLSESCNKKIITYSDAMKIAGNETYQDMLMEYVDCWGPMRTQLSMVHFLLKYRYKANWDRELLENYFPLPFEHMMNKIPSHYSVAYKNHYCHTHSRDKIEKDFGVDIRGIKTHAQLLLKLN